MDKPGYPYIKPDILINRNSYSYSKYYGLPFITVYKEIRRGFIQDPFLIDYNLLEISSCFFTKQDDHSSEIILNKWLTGLLQKKEIDPGLNLLLKRFEVTKRIYSAYDENFRPLNKDEFSESILYIKFGCILAISYSYSKKLQYLNALLKVNDILCSICDGSDNTEKSLLSWLVSRELIFVEEWLNNIKLEK